MYIAGKYIVLGLITGGILVSVILTWLSYRAEKAIRTILECLLAHAEAATDRDIRKAQQKAHFITADDLTFTPNEEDIDIPMFLKD